MHREQRDSTLDIALLVHQVYTYIAESFDCKLGSVVGKPIDLLLVGSAVELRFPELGETFGVFSVCWSISTVASCESRIAVFKLWNFDLPYTGEPYCQGSASSISFEYSSVNSSLFCRHVDGIFFYFSHDRTLLTMTISLKTVSRTLLSILYSYH